MKIAVLGTRGIPNNHGGFEQFAEYLAKGLVERGVEVWVYNSHSHPYQGKEWLGANIIHCYDPEDKMGTAGQFIYDLNCIIDARKRKFDIILQLGYTSSSVWGWLLPRKNTVITTNMDGLEWKRSKYSKAVQKFLKKAERWATIYSDFWISDSLGIQKYLKDEYQKMSVYIPYGSNTFDLPDINVLQPYHLEPYCYDMLIARLEPENNIEVILEGVKNSSNQRPFLVVGKHETSYGNYLKEKFGDCAKIRFCGGIYDIGLLNNLRYFSNLYFHGHSVGGTNPSLLEAMGSQALICAHRNVFNSAILEDDALYFENETEVKEHLEKVKKYEFSSFIKNNFEKIEKKYNWDLIIDQYLDHFKAIARH